MPNENTRFHQPFRVNVGCGASPIAGWRNFDNSTSLLLARIPFSDTLLRATRLISETQASYIAFARNNEVEFANATIRLPLPDASAEVVYTSHMLEHLDRHDVQRFLAEMRRILQPGGVLRISVPDLRQIAEAYLENGDADRFVEGTMMAGERPRGVAGKLKALLIGPRHHLWMFDGPSLAALLRRNGFVDVSEISAGETRITNPGPLDLHERETGSVCVEAEKART